MGIFSWVFSKNTESKSLVRKWIVQEIETVDSTNPDAYGIFVGLIDAAVKFGKDGIGGQDDQMTKVSSQYMGDATIFEIACYTYYRLENWLAKNQPELISELAFPISKWIVEKFSVTFYVDEEWLRQIFDEQLNRYKTIKVDGTNFEEVHRELEQCIRLTKGDKFNKRALQQDSSNSGMDSQFLKISLTAYEETYISMLIGKVQSYSIKNVEKRITEKQDVEQYQEKKDYLYAMALLAQNDFVRACKAFTKVLSTEPEHYDALVQRGLMHIKLHHPADALQDFTAAVNVRPNEATAYLHRGTCYHKNIRIKEEALSDYTAAITLAPNDAAGYFGRGELYDEVALLDEKHALENNNNEECGKITEEFLAAIHDYSQVIALQPEYDAAYANRGLVYARKARATKKVEFIEKAIEDFEKAISLNWENGHLFKQQEEMQELLEQINQ